MDRQFKLVVVLDEQQDNDGNWTPLHQCLLMLLDSPLNHAAHLEVYIRLADQRVIKLHREGCDMPVVQTKDGPARLFQMMGKSLDKVLPSQNGLSGARFRIRNSTSRVKGADFFAESVETLKRAVIFIEFGPVDYNFHGNGREVEYDIRVRDKKPAPDTYSISHYPLAPSLTCVKIATAFERALDIF